MANIIQENIKLLEVFHVIYHVSCTFAGIHVIPDTPENLITAGKAEGGLWEQSLSLS